MSITFVPESVEVRVVVWKSGKAWLVGYPWTYSAHAYSSWDAAMKSALCNVQCKRNDEGLPNALD